MRRLLAAELIKLRTTRTFAALAGVALVVSLAITILTALLSEPTADSVLVDVYLSDVSSLFIAILAIVGITGEWRHRTITSSLLAAPRRTRFLLAKTLAFAVAGAVLSVVISLAIALVGTVILELRDLPTGSFGDLLELSLANVEIAALVGALGVGIGGLVRNQAVAVVVVLMLGFVVEPLVIALAPEVGRFGPFVALPTAITDLGAEALGLEDLDLVSPGAALAAMCAWIAAAFAGAATLLRARDLD